MATTIIDALIVTLGLDGKSYMAGMSDANKARKKLSDATTKGGREQDAQERRLAADQRNRQREQDARAKSTVDGIKRIRNEVLTLAAIFTAGVGIKDFVTNTINSAANLGYLAANLKMSTEDITAWSRASERAGGSAEGLVGQLKESADALAQLKSGMGPNEAMQNFFRWGGSSDDLKDGNTYLLARARIVSDMFARDPTQASVIAKQMGIAEDQFNFIKQGPAAVLALVAAQQKNAAITAKDAEAALKLKNEMLDLRDSLQSTATRILLQLAPTLEKLFAKLESGAEWVAAHKDDIANWVQSAVTALTQFVVMADKVAQALGGWQNVLAGLVALKIVGIVAPLLSLAMGLGGVSSALAGVAAGASGIPVLLAALGALAAYGGYKAAEFLFGDKVDPAKAKPAESALKSKSRLRAEANRQRLEVGLPPLAEKSLKDQVHDDIEQGRVHLRDKSQLHAEASRQRVAVGLPPLASAGSDDRAQEIMTKLKAMGWTPEQAAGITASFEQESSLDPDRVNPKSGARGLGQWLSKDRLDNFKKFSGKDLAGSTLDDQLRFFQHEVTNGSEQQAGRKLRATTNAEDAARVHSEAYERPGSAEANIARRQALAAQLASANRIANAAAVAHTPAGAAASVPASTHNQTSTSTNETTIEKIEIITQATDAKGIASEIRPALGKYAFATQANTGMQ